MRLTSRHASSPLPSRKWLRRPVCVLRSFCLRLLLISRLHLFAFFRLRGFLKNWVSFWPPFAVYLHVWMRLGSLNIARKVPDHGLFKKLNKVTFLDILLPCQWKYWHRAKNRLRDKTRFGMYNPQNGEKSGFGQSVCVSVYLSVCLSVWPSVRLAVAFPASSHRRKV